MKKIPFIIDIILFLNGMASAQTAPKREFRGAWIQTIFQGEYAKMSVDEPSPILLLLAVRR